MSTASMSKPVPATIEVAEHEAIVKALREEYTKQITTLSKVLRELSAKQT